MYDDDVVLHFTDGGNRYSHAHAHSPTRVHTRPPHSHSLALAHSQPQPQPQPHTHTLTHTLAHSHTHTHTHSHTHTRPLLTTLPSTVHRLFSSLAGQWAGPGHPASCAPYHYCITAPKVFSLYFSLYLVNIQCKSFAKLTSYVPLLCLTFSQRGTVLAGPQRGLRMIARRRTARRRRSRLTHGCRSLTREAARSRRRC